MSENKRKIPKKYAIPLFITFLILLCCAGLALYKSFSEAEEQYYYVSSGDVELVSVSPRNESGISTAAKIILEWNRPVDESLCEKVELKPSARGNWFVYGNYLIFEPQSLAPGTYYTVSIPAGTTLVRGVSTLKEDLFFAFETENPALRFPKQKALSLQNRSFSFKTGEEVNIPVSYFAENGEKLKVTLYQSADSKNYIDAMAKLFSYPAWAELSIADFKADTKGFKTLSGDETEVTANNTVSLGVLAPGQYLVRLEGTDFSRDFALTVGNLDYDWQYDSRQLVLWLHENGKALEDATVTCNDVSETTDGNGFVAVAGDLTPGAVAKNPALLGTVIKNGKTETVAFLTADDITPEYRGILAVNRPQGSEPGILEAKGSLFTAGGAPVNGNGELRIISAVNTVKKASVAVENGYFDYQWDDLSLVDGTYEVSLFYNNEKAARDVFTLGEPTEELVITASADKTRIQSGETVSYTVTVFDGKGNPLTDGEVLLNGADGVALDKKGTATFEKTYQTALSGILKEAEFTVESPDGEAAPVKVGVYVSGEQKKNLSDTAKTDSGKGETLNIGFIDDTYTVTEDDADAVAVRHYADGEYGQKASSENAVISGPGRITVAPEQYISADFDYQGIARRISVISLCRGMLPLDKQGQTVYGEAYNERHWGTPEANAVFTASQPLSVSFSTLNRRGNYFLRVWCEAVDCNTVSYYVPVTLNSVLLFADTADYYPLGKNTELTFGLKTEAKGDFDYTLVLGDSVYTGKANSDFSVALGKLDEGFYSGEITVSAQGVAVASRGFDFTVASEEPIAYDVKEGILRNACKIYRVKEKDAEALKVLCETNKLPGDQIFCQLQSALIDYYLGENCSPGVTVENTLRSCQNVDGSFSRKPGGKDDLLISVLVAEQDAMSYDSDSLLAFLQRSLKDAANPETAALACWGLSCFDIDCNGSLELVADSKHSTQRTRLYLAEALWEAGSFTAAEKVYRSIAADLSQTDNGSYIKTSDEQEAIVLTALFLDLAVKMKTDDVPSLMSYLLAADINYQTGRYLLVKNILKNIGSVDTVTAEEKARSGYAYYSLVAADLADVPALDTTLTVKDNKVRKLKKGEIATLTVEWPKTENHLYQVCVLADSGCALLNTAADNGYSGYIRQLTDEAFCSFSFRCKQTGENRLPKVYVLDLTAGEVIGWGQPEGKVIP